MTVLQGASEGRVDEAVIRRLAGSVGAAAGVVYGRRGKAHLLGRLRAYNAAAMHAPWFVLMDLDMDADCAPDFVAECMPTPAPLMCFRIAVRSVEAWLLSDRERIAKFLALPLSMIPADPELLSDPKATLIGLASRSRRRDIRQDLVPEVGARRRVGPAYSARLVEFVNSPQGWRPDVASGVSESLRRCISCLSRLRTV
jgi:hypothetical protein